MEKVTHEFSIFHKVYLHRLTLSKTLQTALLCKEIVTPLVNTILLLAQRIELAELL